MKRALIVVSLLLSLSAVACARNVLLNWDQADPGPVTSNAYRRSGPCSGTGSFTKINTADIPANTFTDSNVPFGRWSYQVTAVATVEGAPVESAPSNCAEVVVTPSSPQNLTLTLDPP